MKKILSLFAVVVLTMVASFSLTSCEKDDIAQGFSIEYEIKDNGKNTNVNGLIEWVRDYMIENGGFSVEVGDVISKRGTSSSTQSDAKKYFEKACKEVVNDDDFMYILGGFKRDLSDITLKLKYMQEDTIIDTYSFASAN